MSIKNKQDNTYKVVRDSREKSGYGWLFEAKDECLGTEIAKLDSADYSIKNYETTFAIERKFNTNEIATNIWEKRFEEELKRLEEFAHPFMIFEFEYKDVLQYPINSGLPVKLYHKTKMTANYMAQTISRYQMRYKTKIIFAGNHGKEAAESLFKFIAKYGIKNDAK